MSKQGKWETNVNRKSTSLGLGPLVLLALTQLALVFLVRALVPQYPLKSIIKEFMNF